MHEGESAECSTELTCHILRRCGVSFVCRLCTLRSWESAEIERGDRKTATSVWNMRGIRMEQALNTYGICEYAWNMHGIRMQYAWNMNRICVEYAWNTDGAGLQYVWNMREYA